MMTPHPSHRASLVVLIALTMVGCEVISESAIEARFDQDGDGFDAVQFGGEDCDDTNRDVHPSAVEICDGIDNDCSGDADSDALDRRTWYRDLDGDGYGSPSTETPANTCFPPEGFVGDATDCNDDPQRGGAQINPQTVWYTDDDGDGYGDPDNTVVTCIQLPQLVDNALDCDDTDATMHPQTEWWEDSDGDGYGNPAASVQECWTEDDVVAGYLRAAEGLPDCNDAEPGLYPGAASAEADPALCAVDSDADGFGDAYPDLAGAEAGTDCDDSSEAVYPGAKERWWDDVLNDCGSMINTLPISESNHVLSGVAVGNTLGKSVVGLGHAIGCTTSLDDCTDDTARPDFLVGAPGESSHSASNGAVLAYAGESLDTPAKSFVGTSDINRLGISLAAPGDLDDDGNNDLIIGSQDDYAWVIFSNRIGDATAHNLGTSHRSSFVTLYKAETPGDQLGFAVSAAGNFTGDGTPDIAMGAHQSSAWGDGSGRVYVFPKPDHHTTVDLEEIRADQALKFEEAADASDVEDPTLEADHSKPDPPPIWVIEPEPDCSGGAFGWALTGSQDLDGDGFSDLAISAPGASYAGVESGRIYLAMGADGAVWEELRDDSETSGFSEADSDEDEVGFVMDLYAEDFVKVDGALEGDRLGASVAHIGDFSGDGYADLAMTATGTSAAPTQGRVYLLFGGATVLGPGELPSIHVVADLTIEPDDELGLANFGASISAAGPMLSVPDGWTAGDLDHDDHADLLVGSPKSPVPAYDSGQVYLIYGGVTGSWDVTDLVGMPAEDVGSEDGRTGFLHTGATFSGEASYSLGFAVGGVGDVSGDGLPDMVLGAPGADLTGTSAGAAFLIYGEER